MQRKLSIDSSTRSSATTVPHSAAVVALTVAAILCIVDETQACGDPWRYKFRLTNLTTMNATNGGGWPPSALLTGDSVGDGAASCAAVCGRLYACRAFRFGAGGGGGGCAIYTEGPPFLDDGSGGQPVMRKLVARYEGCVERWAGGRRFCLMQQRLSGGVSFQRTWTEYENGFGDADNFWIGLKTLQALTAGGGATVRFEFTKLNGSKYYCEYNGFTVGGPATKYELGYASYATDRSNIAVDSLDERSRGMKFSTTDQDNDLFGTSCSNDYGGGAGWWFRGCFRANPNGLYSDTEVRAQSKYMTWYHIDGEFVSLKEARMMVQLDG